MIGQIRAAIDEDERVAKAAGGTTPDWSEGGDAFLYAVPADLDGDYCVAQFGMGDPPHGDPLAMVQHAARHDPKRTLATVAAYREILEAWEANERRIQENREKWQALMTAPRRLSAKEQDERNQYNAHSGRLHGIRDALKFAIDALAKGIESA